MVDILVGLVVLASAVAIMARFELETAKGDVTGLTLSVAFGGVVFISVCAAFLISY